MTVLFKKITSVLLIVSVIFGCAAVSGFAAETQNGIPIDKVEYDPTDPGFNEGREHLTTAQFFDVIDVINNTLGVVTGIKLFDPDSLKVSADGLMYDLFECWTEKSNGTLDCFEILDRIPNLTPRADKIVPLLFLDPQATSKKIRTLANEKFAENKPVAGFILYYMSAYVLIMDEAVIYTVPDSGNPEVQKIMVAVKYRTGDEDNFDSGLIFNTSTKVLSSTSGRGIFGFNLDTNDYTIFPDINIWQRNLGFCILYDYLANMTIYDYDTKRVYFTYDGKEWLIQIWKGVYWIAAGAEIGVYNREAGKGVGSFYKCAPDEDMMVMSLNLYQGSRKVLTRPKQLHWWILGFTIEEKIYDAEYLTVDGTVEFPTEEMAAAFEESAEKIGVTIERDGADVYYLW